MGTYYKVKTIHITTVYFVVIIENTSNTEGARRISMDEEKNKQSHDNLRNITDDREMIELVRNLKDQLHMLKDQNRNLKGKVEEEVQARKRLENILKNNVLPNRNDIEWNDD